MHRIGMIMAGLLKTACAGLIMTRLQQQSTRERPDTFMQLESPLQCRVSFAWTKRITHSFPEVFQSRIVEHSVHQEPHQLVFSRLASDTSCRGTWPSYSWSRLASGERWLMHASSDS